MACDTNNQPPSDTDHHFDKMSLHFFSEYLTFAPVDEIILFSAVLFSGQEATEDHHLTALNQIHGWRHAINEVVPLGWEKV